MNRGLSITRLASFVFFASLCVACFFFVLLRVAGPTNSTTDDPAAHPRVVPPRALLDTMLTHHKMVRGDAALVGLETKRTRVCIVTMEIGFSSPGGIGTAYTGLALALVERGHDVTVLFVDDNRHTREEWMVILAPLKNIHITISGFGVGKGKKKEGKERMERRMEKSKKSKKKGEEERRKWRRKERKQVKRGEERRRDGVCKSIKIIMNTEAGRAAHGSNRVWEIFLIDLPHHFTSR